jgi:hypothetical protein
VKQKQLEKLALRWKRFAGLTQPSYVFMILPKESIPYLGLKMFVLRLKRAESLAFGDIQKEMLTPIKIPKRHLRHNTDWEINLKSSSSKVLVLQ